MHQYDPTPTLGVALPFSRQQLNSYKQQLLKQAYEGQITKPKQTFNPQDIIDKLSGSSIKSSRSMGILPSYQSQPNPKNNKKTLLNQNMTQIQPRSLLKQAQQRESRNKDNDMLTIFQKQHQIEVQRQQQIKQQYKHHLQDQITRKNSVQQMLKREESQMEANRMHRHSSLINKQQSFRQYYDHVNKYRDNIAKDYLAYVGDQQQQKQKIKLQQMQEIRHSQQLMNLQCQEERKIAVIRRAQLKATLQKQIAQTNSNRSKQLKQFKNRGYVYSQHNLYNPISNPIDYQLDINNRYVLQQLLTKPI